MNKVSKSINHTAQVIRKTGGRGTSEIHHKVHSLLKRYENLKINMSPPIDIEVLADLQKAKIIYRDGPEKWVASLMPMGHGFIINVNDSMSLARKRNAVCHEIAHTFFYNSANGLPKRMNNIRPDKEEELLCFWAAREMLVPASLLKLEIDRLGTDAVYSVNGILYLARTFLASPDIISFRLTHDLSLLGPDWIILWYPNDNAKSNIRPKSLYPKLTSTALSNSRKLEIINVIRNSVVESLEKIDVIEKVGTIGKKNKFLFKHKTESVKGFGVSAITWVSPLTQ